MMDKWKGTVWEYELLLTEHYLRSDGPLGAAPLRFIDVNDEELAQALKISNVDEARKKFLGSFNASLVQDVLSGRLQPSAPSEIESPGWFRFLILTCVIASISSEQSTIGDFRDRLAEQLKTNINFDQLSGVTILWEKLVLWCENKHKEGRPFKKIILPELGSWRQIGYSLKISFPSRRELDRIQKVFGPKKLNLSNVSTLLKAIQDEIYNHNWSNAFISAFNDFRDIVTQGNRVLEEHPLVLVMKKTSNLYYNGTPKKILLVSISTNIDNETICTITFSDEKTKEIIEQNHFTILLGEVCKADLDIRDFIRILPKICMLNGRDDLAWSYHDGIFVFEELDWGQWNFTRTPSNDLVRLLIRPDLIGKADNLKGSSFEWMLTDPVSYNYASKLLITLKNQNNSKDKILPRPTLSGGIKVGNIYLGLPCCIPNITASKFCDVALQGNEHNSGNLFLEYDEHNHLHIKATTKINGRWILKVSENSVPVIDLSLKFTDKAIEHAPEAYKIDKNNWISEVQSKFVGVKTKIIPANFNTYSYYYDDTIIEDFCEAIYAGGINGWDENKLLPFIKRFFNSTELSSWDVLRLLEDVGWLTPRTSSSWKARRWYLKKPSLFIYSDDLLVLEGATCCSFRERFKFIVEENNGRVEYVRPIDGWSIPTMIAFVDFKKISNLFEIDILTDSSLILPKSSEKIIFAESDYTTLSRQVKSSWSWSLGKFTYKTIKDEEIALDRLCHNGDRSPDIFRLKKHNGHDILLQSRTTAIIEAYKFAKKPMFEFRNNSQELLRLTSEGGFTREICRYLRLRHGVGAFLKQVNNKWEYYYTADHSDITLLKKWYGHYIISGTGQETVVNWRTAIIRNKFGPFGALVGKYGRNWGV